MKKLFAILGLVVFMGALVAPVIANVKNTNVVTSVKEDPSKDKATSAKAENKSATKAEAKNEVKSADKKECTKAEKKECAKSEAKKSGCCSEKKTTAQNQ
jgi:hypothetical protein